MQGRIHSIETLGALDGPGLRCVVFLQGCPFRCLYCHNPDTWDSSGGRQADSDEIVACVRRLRPYFGGRGGLTLSGGEPLMQPAFAEAILRGCKEQGIHTAIDTCGWRLDEPARRVLAATDLVILDVKHADPARHRELTGGELGRVVEFLNYVGGQGIDVWVRQVIVPGWNDMPADVERLAELLRGVPTLGRAELLAYHSMARGKWEALGMRYELADLPELDARTLARLQQLLDGMLPPMRRPVS